MSTTQKSPGRLVEDSHYGNNANRDRPNRIRVTHVDAFGPYLKIFGQTNPDAVMAMKAEMEAMLPTCFVIDPYWSTSKQQALLIPDAYCIYKDHAADSSKYELRRSRIINALTENMTHQQGISLKVLIEFVDIGCTAVVPTSQLFFPEIPLQLKSKPALCTPFIMLGVCTEWKQTQLDEIGRMIAQQTLDISVDMEINQWKFISMKWKEFNFAEFLIHQKKIGAPIGKDLLQEHFLKITKPQRIIEDNHSIVMNNNKNYNTNPHHNNNNVIPSDDDWAKRLPKMTSDQPKIDRLRPQLRLPHQRLMNVPPQLGQPRLLQNVGNLHVMMQGIHHQNSRLPYTGLSYVPAPLGAHPVPRSVLKLTNPIPRAMQSQLTPASPLSSLTPSYNRNATYKSNSLPVGNTYDVWVSYVENGPCLFSVQLNSAQEELTNMMEQIEQIQLKPIVGDPIFGTACIARYFEDKNMYRALIMKVMPDTKSCKVAYIDYGNTAMVSYQDIYEMPSELLNAKPFANCFTLSGYRILEPIDESLKKAFKDLVLYQKCKLKVMPLEGPPIVQYGELYLQDKNVMDILKQIQKSRLEYADADPLNNNDIVEIRYIDSPSHFYVQKVANIPEFEQLMDDMFLYYNANQVVPNNLELGAPCIVKYENEWYRAEIMRADATAIVVRHVDFGYEQKVTKNLLSTVAKKHLSLPRQAVQCCLKGFENNDKNLATTQFEMLAEESNRKRRSFTVKVFRIQPDGVNLINLCTKDLNVMKKLYKLSMPFEKYLSLEKEEFNIHTHTPSKILKEKENGLKTPSVASSNEVASLLSGKKGSDSIVPTMLSDWDRNSFGSSAGNPESLSSSKKSNQIGNRFGKSPRNNKQNQHMNSDSSHERQTNGFVAPEQNIKYSKARSIASDTSSQSKSPSKQTSPNNSDRRNNKHYNGGQQGWRADRPQNAPQGFSQPRHSISEASDQTSNKSFNVAKSPNGSVASDQKRNASIEEYIPLNRPFEVQHIETPLKEEVIISWWISPHQFYTHLKSRIPAFERLMQDMQLFYRRKPLQQLQLKVNSHVVARNRKENTIYRARIIGCNQMQRKFKVYCVDFGNQFTVSSDDIWQIEKRFADLPCMAYLCSFEGIISNYDHLYVIDQMEKYLPGNAQLTCEYLKREQDLYYVNVNVNNVSLKNTLKSEGIITEIGSDLRLNLLAGQQIRAKISNIKDMLNFKIKMLVANKDINLLCSYDDVRFVKSNPDVVKKFKDFYENKSFILNIKDVNDNKVVLLRPLMPLLKEDIPSQICTQPILLESFEARVVNITTPYRLYVQLPGQQQKIAQLKDDMNVFYKSNGSAPFDGANGMDQVYAVLTNDGNWYRGRLLNAANIDNMEGVEIFLIDYGRVERVQRSKLQKLSKQFYNLDAHAIEVNLPMRLPADQQSKQMKTKKPIDVTVIDELNKLVLNHIVTVEAYEVRHNHLIADILFENRKSVINALKEKQLIRGKDLDYMRRTLEKDKSNMYEYIETVDLTLEDEDDDKKSMGKSSKNSTPKKKKSKFDDKENVPVKEVKPMMNVDKLNDSKLTETDDELKVFDKIETPLTSTPTKGLSKPGTESETVSSATTPTVTPTPTGEHTNSESDAVDPYAHMEKAVLSHCDNPAQFFVHPYDKLSELHKLQENLQIVATSLPPLMRVINDAHCISHFSVDKNWYRAKILDAELMVIKFIDFGNTDCVTDTTHIKEMSVFPDIEPMCIPCALPIKPNGTADWVDAANTIFNESYEKNLYFEYITKGDVSKRSFINLYIDGVNVAEKIIQDGYAKPLMVVESGENCYISHVNGITDFYIQYEKDSKVLELIEIYLEDFEQLPKLDKFEHDKIVAALFSDDEKWYRAKLLKQIPNEGYEVIFIDYGNTSISRECREISEEIANLPWLSKKCALELPEHCLAWSDEAEKKFNEIGVSETIFTVELCEPAADHAAVHLLIDGHNIIEDLAPLCEQKPVEMEMNVSFLNSTTATTIYEIGTLYEAFVSHVNSPFDFYVQFAKDVVRLEDISNTLNSLGLNALETVEVNQLCAALFPDDNALYRARVLEVIPDEEKKYRVVFIDFGNEAITTDVRSLPQDLMQLREFAHHCKLENEDKIKEHGNGPMEIFNALMDFCEFVVKVDLVDSTVTPSIVKLYTTDANENVCEKINSILGLTATTDSSNPPMCLISHFVSPTNFYIQYKKDLPKLEILRKMLAKSNVDKFLALNEAPKLGDICIAYSPEEDCYTRGCIEHIVDVDTGKYEILSIDYGNIFMTTKVFDLWDYWKALPALAHKCRLNEVPQAFTNFKLDQCFAAVMEAHFGEMFEIVEEKFINNDSEHVVKLQVNYKDLAEELAKAVSSEDDQDIALGPILKDCYVVYVNSPTSFYIQLDENVDRISMITNKLLDAETTLEPFTDLTVGAICAAQFPDDEAYYRAKIIKVLDNKECEVHFIDFGNTAVTKNFRRLPGSLLDYEAFSAHCTLESIGLNAAEMNTIFQSLIDARHSETFQIEFLKMDDDPIVTRLFYKNNNMTVELVQLLKEAKHKKEPSNGIVNNPSVETDEPNSSVPKQ